MAPTSAPWPPPDLEEQLAIALQALRDFRLEMVRRAVHPVVARAALTWALEVDTKVLVEQGWNLSMVEADVAPILAQLRSISREEGL